MDDGRWEVANRGQPVNEYFLKSKLRKLLPTEGEYSEPKTRCWRPLNDPKGNPLKGYHELHLVEAFERYLNKGLPSKASTGPEPTADDRSTTSDVYVSSSSVSPKSSETTDTVVESHSKTTCYPVSEPQFKSETDPTHPPFVSDTQAGVGVGNGSVSDISTLCVGSVSDQKSSYDTEKIVGNQMVDHNVSDVSDKIGGTKLKKTHTGTSQSPDAEPLTAKAIASIPRGVAGRCTRKGCTGKGKRGHKEGQPPVAGAIKPNGPGKAEDDA
jgi:hypothetical protein